MLKGTIYVDQTIESTNDELMDTLGNTVATIESRSLERIHFTHGSFFAATPTNSTKEGTFNLRREGKGTKLDYECDARTYYKVFWAIIGIITFGIGFIGFYIYTMKGPRQYILNMLNVITQPRYSETPSVDTKTTSEACPQCGTQLTPGSVFCPNCGVSVK